MTVSRIKVRLPTRFPSSVSAASPIVLDRTGGAFAFSLDANALQVTFGGLFQPVDQTLTALAAIGSTAGLLTQTAADTFAQRTITGTAAEITVTNGSGAAGNPTLSLPAALTYTGKTVTGGTFSGPSISGAAITTSTFNGNTWTAGTGVLTLGAGKTLTASNTLTFTGTDGSTAAFGTGGTVAYVANKLSVFAATTSLELKGVISDETGSGALVFATTPTLVTPVLGVATATSINAAAIAPGQYSGEPSNADATAGNIGEYGEASVASNAVSLTSTTPANLANVVLQPGEWEVSFQPNYTGTTASVTGLRTSLSLTSATEDNTPGRFVGSSYNSTNPFATFNVGYGQITRRVKVAAASTTTVYAVGRADFSGGNCFGYGLLFYRRVR